MALPTLGIAVIGAGIVGGGVTRLLLQRDELLAGRTGCRLELVRLVDIDLERARATGAPEAVLCSSYEEAIADPRVDAVVELVGGTTVAYQVVEAALTAGKPVVTANKALLAVRGAPLFALADRQALPLYFEASVCGAMPIIRSIRDGLVANELQSLLAIVNGTCNYILTQMLGAGQTYEEALGAAQKQGFAEADPTFDVEGIDSAHKLSILSALGFGTYPPFDRLPVEGITGLHLGDVRMASEMGYITKLLAVARPEGERIFLSVHPALLPKAHPLSSVNGSMTAVSMYGDAAMESLLCGRGAGALPTASAVVGDLADLARAKAAGARPLRWSLPTKNRYALAPMEDYRCRYFLRLNVKDQYGVLGRIAGILGENKVSIASVSQREEEKGIIPLVLVTHEAREGDLRRALAAIDSLDFVTPSTGVLRVER